MEKNTAVEHSSNGDSGGEGINQEQLAKLLGASTGETFEQFANRMSSPPIQGSLLWEACQIMTVLQGRINMCLMRLKEHEGG